MCSATRLYPLVSITRRAEAVSPAKAALHPPHFIRGFTSAGCLTLIDGQSYLQ